MDQPKQVKGVRLPSPLFAPQGFDSGIEAELPLAIFTSPSCISVFPSIRPPLCSRRETARNSLSCRLPRRSVAGVNRSSEGERTVAIGAGTLRRGTLLVLQNYPSRDGHPRLLLAGGISEWAACLARPSLIAPLRPYEPLTPEAWSLVRPRGRGSGTGDGAASSHSTSAAGRD